MPTTSAQCARRYSNVFETVRRAHSRDADLLLQRLVPSAPGAFVHDVHQARVRRAASSLAMTGREKLTRLRRALDMFGLKRSKNQRMFHVEIIKALMKNVFMDDYEEHMDELLREFNVTHDFQPEVLIVAPRRFGKTYTIGMIVAACLYALNGGDTGEPFVISIFSTGRRASLKLLELVYRFLVKLPGMATSIVKHNVETLWIQGPNGAGDMRQVYSYPSKVSVYAQAHTR